MNEVERVAGDKSHDECELDEVLLEELTVRCNVPVVVCGMAGCQLSDTPVEEERASEPASEK